jgi:hypothetical protein
LGDPQQAKVHHKDLTVVEYAEKILRPSYRIINAIDPQALVLPCAYNNLSVMGNREDFWEPARGFYDIHNVSVKQGTVDQSPLGAASAE